MTLMTDDSDNYDNSDNFEDSNDSDVWWFEWLGIWMTPESNITWKWKKWK